MRPLIRRTERVYVLIELNGEVLLIKNWLGRQDWHLPGGGKRRGETARQAAARELREEIGVIVLPEDLLPVAKGIWETDGLGFRYSILSVKLKSKPKISLKKLEIIEARWWPQGGLRISAPREIQRVINWSYKSAAKTGR